MARPSSEITVVCQNPECPFYGREEGKHLRKRGRNRAGTQRYSCVYCNKYSVETKGTLLYRRRLDDSGVKQLCQLLTRHDFHVATVSRHMGLSPATVRNWMAHLAANPADRDGLSESRAGSRQGSSRGLGRKQPENNARQAGAGPAQSPGSCAPPFG